MGWTGRWGLEAAGPQTPFRLDPMAAADVAAAHGAAPRVGGALARAAYGRLVEETDRIFIRITQAARPVRVSFTLSMTPYSDADELITAIRRDHMVEITAAASTPDRLHPLMGSEFGGAYDRFRAVHDILGHGFLNVGFDRDGEYAAWRCQERHHSPLARRASATELHGEHSVCWTTGQVAEHKAALLDEQLIERSRIGAHRPAIARTHRTRRQGRAAPRS